MTEPPDSTARSSFAIPLAQRVLGAKYRLVRPLVAGGMGTVWIAEHLNLRSAVAVKLLSRELAETEEAEQRFLREACTAASLRSPHVVQILDHGVDAGTPFIVMELLDGESLGSRLQREQRLGPAQTERIVRHVARAVGRAHEAGIVHRDLKPSNIFIVANEEEEIVKVLDFGIAKISDGWTSAQAARTRTGTFLGTPGYVSPEQAEGASNIDHRTDIWSLGVIAFECLLGRPPFVAESFGSLLLAICSRSLPVPSEQGPVPRGFDDWFARACARAPEQRFQSAREAAQELRRVLELGDPEAVSSGSTPGSSRAERSAGRGSSQPPWSAAAASAVSSAPFVLTSQGSGQRARSAAWRARWAVLATALGVVVLGLLARSCFDAGGGGHTLHAGSLTAGSVPAPAPPAAPPPLPASPPESPPASPPPRAAGAARSGGLAAGVAPERPSPQPAPAPERRVRAIQPASSAAKPAVRRPAAGASPKPAEPTTINLGLVPLEQER